MVCLRLLAQRGKDRLASSACGLGPRFACRGRAGIMEAMGTMWGLMLVIVVLAMPASAVGSAGNQQQQQQHQQQQPPPLPLLASAADSPTLVDLNPAHTLHVFDGWGTSLSWWANGVGGWVNYTDAGVDGRHKLDELLDLFFGMNGLRLNLVRYNIGGGAGPGDKKFLRGGADVGLYLPTEEGAYDWSADATQRLVLAGVLARWKAAATAPTFVQATSYSPPWWMTKSQSVTGSKGCKQPPNGTRPLTPAELDEACTNLRDDQYQAFATFLATVVAHFYTEWGVVFDSLTPLNGARLILLHCACPQQPTC